MKIFAAPSSARGVLDKSENKWTLLFSYHVHYETIWMVHDHFSVLHDLVDMSLNSMDVGRPLTEAAR